MQTLTISNNTADEGRYALSFEANGNLKDKLQTRIDTTDAPDYGAHHLATLTGINLGRINNRIFIVSEPILCVWASASMRRKSTISYSST